MASFRVLRVQPPVKKAAAARCGVGGDKNFFDSIKFFLLTSKMFLCGFLVSVIEKISTPKIASATSRQNIGGSAPITKRRRRRPQIVGGGGGAKGSNPQ